MKKCTTGKVFKVHPVLDLEEGVNVWHALSCEKLLRFEKLRSRSLGNPRSYSTWEDESYNRSVKLLAAASWTRSEWRCLSMLNSVDPSSKRRRRS